MKKYMIAMMTGAFAFSLLVGCSSQGDSKADSPTSGVQNEKPAAPTSGTLTHDEQKSGAVDSSTPS